MDILIGIKKKNANILHEQGLNYGVSDIGFYSTVEKALGALKQEKGTKDQFKGYATQKRS